MLRLAPLRCARSTRPPLGPLCDRRRRGRQIRFDLGRPPSCRGEGRTCLSEDV
nr:MAG TPA: hypothetical protein [Caudoviricetes sp.]